MFIITTAIIPSAMLILCLFVSLSLKNRIPTSVDRRIDPPEYIGNKNDPSITEIAYVLSHWNTERIIPTATARIYVPAVFVLLESLFFERIKK